MGVHVTEMLVDKLREKAGDINRGAVNAFDVLKDTLRDVLGEPQSLTVGQKRPQVILVVGVNGVGKTTTIGKLAMRFRQEGYSVLLAACDTFRAAAVEQLGIWAERSNSDFISAHEGADPASVAFDAINRAKITVDRHCNNRYGRQAAYFQEPHGGTQEDSASHQASRPGSAARNPHGPRCDNRPERTQPSGSFR